MAAELPSALKSADIQRFATRAAQLEKYKPIATYWLEYYILQQLLNKSLHTKSPEAQAYAVHLMDKLEQTKDTLAFEDAVTDDVAAKAYMEQFALDTFNRADETQRADKVTRQTADTFQAATTFFDSLAIWGDLDTESKAKRKFAKFHALRIIRAIKTGTDPNETNPKVEPPPVLTEEEGLDAELKDLEKSARASQSAHQEPVVETLPDSEPPLAFDWAFSEPAPPEPEPPAATEPDESVPAHAPAPEPEFMAEATAEPAISPIEAARVSPGGGYFPSVPDVASVSDETSPDIGGELQPKRQATIADMMSPHIDTDSHIPLDPPSTAETQTSQVMPGKHITTKATPGTARSHHQGASRSSAPPARTAATPSTATQAASNLPASGSYRTDDDAVMAAQKHAKWAISALNFEDVPTAVKELRIALQSLGGL